MCKITVFLVYQIRNNGYKGEICMLSENRLHSLWIMHLVLDASNFFSFLLYFPIYLAAHEIEIVLNVDLSSCSEVLAVSVVIIPRMDHNPVEVYRSYHQIVCTLQTRESRRNHHSNPSAEYSILYLIHRELPLSDICIHTKIERLSNKGAYAKLTLWMEV